MAAQVSIPQRETENRSRLTVLLIEGGTQVLRNVLLDLLFDFHLQRNKADIQKQVSISINKHQFELLFPDQGQLPSLQDLDASLLAFVSKNVLGIYVGSRTPQAPYLREKILNFLGGKGFSNYLELNKPFLRKLANRRKNISRYINFIRSTEILCKVRVQDLDIIVLSFILLNGFNLKPTSGVWNKMPLNTHTEIGDDLTRLREWRNVIVDRKTAGIDTYTFNVLWDNIEALLQRRLGGYTSMVIHLTKLVSVDGGDHSKTLRNWFLMDTKLRNVFTDVEININSAELRTIQTIDELSTEICIPQKFGQKVDDKVNELDIDGMHLRACYQTYEETFKTCLAAKIKALPKLPTDDMTSLADGWKKKDTLFCETKASVRVRCELTMENIVSITGAPGSGKKATARHVALLLKQDGYHLYPVATPGEITENFCETLKQVFYVEYPVGEIELQRETLAMWEMCNKRIQNFMKKPHFKLLVIISPKILQELQRFNLVLARNVVDITEQSLRLSQDEKSNIFKTYCPLVKPSLTYLNCPFDCFPLLCSIWSNVKTVNNSRFQNIPESPFQVVKELFENLREMNRIQFYGMLLCAVMDNVYGPLIDMLIDDDTMTADRAKINKILLGIGLQADTFYRSVKRELDLINDLYVQNIHGSYVFVHQTFKDAVLYLVGEESTGFIFQFFPASVIREKVIISSSCEPDDNMQHIIVQDTPGVWNMLRTRIRKDLRNSKYEDAFMDNHLSKDSLADVLLQEIKLMDYKQRQKCDDRGKTMLHWSVSRSMITVMSCLLEAGLDVNSLNENGCTAIFYASSCEIIPILIAHHANLNVLNIHGETPLLRNLSGGYDLVQMLLNYNADVNLQGENNDTALVRAAHYNDTHLVEILLNNGADVNGRRQDSDTAIVNAVLHNNEEMIKLLLDYGANVDNIGRYGNGALVCAMKKNNSIILNLSLGKSDNVNCLSSKYNAVEIDGPDMLSVLLEVDVYKLYVKKLRWSFTYANAFRKTFSFSYNDLQDRYAEINSLKMVQILLKQVANPSLNGASPHSALIKAAYHNQLEIATFLLRNFGADVNMKCTGYRYLDTAIVYAAYHNNEPMVDLFLDHQADVNFRGDNRDTAIVKAAYNNNTELVSILLEEGADVNLHGKYSDPAIVRATNHKNSELVSILIKNGANVDLFYKYNDPAIVRAAFHNNCELISILLKHGADVNLHGEYRDPAIVKAVYRNNKGLVQLFLTSGANPNSFGKFRDPALGKASHKNNMEIINMLMNYGVDVNSYRIGCNTPLSNAVFHRNIDMVRKLLEKGAHVNSQNDFISFNGTDWYAMIVLKKILSKFRSSVYINIDDIDIFAEDTSKLRQTKQIDLCIKNRKSALMQAVYNDDMDIVHILLNHKANVNFLSADFAPAIVSAARNNNLEMVKLLLRHKADPNLYIKSRDTAVVHAAHHSNMSMLKCLVSHGADVNLCCEDRDSALVRATICNNTQMVKYLVSHGSNVNYRGSYRLTALVEAAKNNNMQLVKLFLSKGADVNLYTNCYDSALSKAIGHKNIHMIQILIAHGADVSISCEWDETYLSRAVRFNNLEMVNLLLRNDTNVNQQFDGRSSLVALAAERNNEDIVKCLLDHGADVNEGPIKLDSALVRAAKNNNIKIVRLLLKANANVDYCRINRHCMTDLRCSTLARAANHNNFEMIKLFIDNGANISQPDHVHEKAILTAVKKNNVDIVKLLLDQGMYLRHTLKANLLYEAINRRNKNMVSMLLEHGMSVDMPSKKHNTPLVRAIRLNDISMTHLLLRTGANNTVNKTSTIRDTALVNAAFNNNTELVKLLLDLGADANLHTAISVEKQRWFRNKHIYSVKQMQELITMVDYDVMAMVNQLLYFYPRIHLHDIGNTALCEATFNNNLKMVKMLLNYGAKLNLHGLGDTPLVNAVNNNNFEMVKLLLRYGASVNVERMYRDTAIVRAARHNNISITKLLLERGAHVNACGEFTYPALFMAVWCNHTKIAQLLLEHGADVNYYDGNCETSLSLAVKRQNKGLVKMLRLYGAKNIMFP